MNKFLLKLRLHQINRQTASMYEKSRMLNDVIIRSLLKEMFFTPHYPVFKNLNYACYLAGGSLANLAQNEAFKIKDFDLYCTLEEDLKELVNFFLEKGTGDHGSFCIDYISDNAITFSHPKINKPQFQLIRKSGQPTEILSTFDFYHCMAAFCYGNVFAHKHFYECAVSKRLCRNPEGENPNPYRIQKFLNRGYHLEDEAAHAFWMLKEIYEEDQGISKPKWTGGES